MGIWVESSRGVNITLGKGSRVHIRKRNEGRKRENMDESFQRQQLRIISFEKNNNLF